MKKLILILLTLFSIHAVAETVTLVGLVPGKYVNSKKSYQLVTISMEDRIIKSINKVTEKQAKALAGKPGVVFLKSGKTYDVIYPGLINLHNHTKQNNLSVWDLARGQFSNRFEWRDWPFYTSSVSANINPWINYGSAMTCAAFRWSEIQALVLGTTYLQGPSSCISNFTIHQVEDEDAYISPKTGVRAPTDLILPDEMTFVWNTLKPIMDSKKVSYETALKEVIYDHCPVFKKGDVLKDGVSTDAALKLLSNQAELKAACGDKDKLPPQFIRYIYWVHGGIIKRKKYLDDPNHGAVIFHLAEGRADDQYNQLEYKLVKLLGLNRPHVNFVHAVGLSRDEFADMAKNKMGIIWSPFSNLLLYGQTLDVTAAMAAGVNIALGSDWTPTGSRSVLEELKIARAYVKKYNLNITDEDLYKMVTENPAKMINHYFEKGVSTDGKDHGVGTIAVGAMASLIAVSKQEENPYTNLMVADERHINLVVVDGKPIYGNETYIKDQFKQTRYEIMSQHIVGVNKLRDSYQDFAVLGTENPDVELGKMIPANFETQDLCDFPIRKVLVHQNSGEMAVIEYMNETKLNLDRFQDIQKLLGTAVMTQPRNLIEPKHSASRPEFATKYFAPLFSCNDPVYMDRFNKFISVEIDQNANQRENTRDSGGLGSGPEKMARDYGF